jgi:hypothetical protein
LNILNVAEKLEMQAKCADEIYIVRCQAKMRSPHLTANKTYKAGRAGRETLIENAERRRLIKLITLISSSIKKVDGCTS